VVTARTGIAGSWHCQSSGASFKQGKCMLGQSTASSEVSAM
jgi:hypothetical protein